MTPSLGIEPGSHWWEASALTTASSLLPKCCKKCTVFSIIALICSDKGRTLGTPNSKCTISFQLFYFLLSALSSKRVVSRKKDNNLQLLHILGNFSCNLSSCWIRIIFLTGRCNFVKRCHYFKGVIIEGLRA